MKGKDNIIKWIIVIVVVIVVGVLSGILSDMLDLNRRSARYIILIILFLGWYFVDCIKNKKK